MSEHEPAPASEGLVEVVRAVVDRIEVDGINDEIPGSPAWCHDYAEQIAAVIAREWLPGAIRAAEARAWDEGWYVRCHTLSAKNPYSGRKVDQYVGPERSYRNKGDGSEGQ